MKCAIFIDAMGVDGKMKLENSNARHAFTAKIVAQKNANVNETIIIYEMEIIIMGERN